MNRSVAMGIGAGAALVVVWVFLALISGVQHKQLAALVTSAFIAASLLGYATVIWYAGRPLPPLAGWILAVAQIIPLLVILWAWANMPARAGSQAPRMLPAAAVPAPRPAPVAEEPRREEILPRPPTKEELAEEFLATVDRSVWNYFHSPLAPYEWEATYDWSGPVEQCLWSTSAYTEGFTLSRQERKPILYLRDSVASRWRRNPCGRLHQGFHKMGSDLGLIYLRRDESKPAGPRREAVRLEFQEGPMERGVRIRMHTRIETSDASPACILWGTPPTEVRGHRLTWRVQAEAKQTDRNGSHLRYAAILSIGLAPEDARPFSEKIEVVSQEVRQPGPIMVTVKEPAFVAISFEVAYREPPQPHRLAWGR